MLKVPSTRQGSLIPELSGEGSRVRASEPLSTYCVPSLCWHVPHGPHRNNQPRVTLPVLRPGGEGAENDSPEGQSQI